MPIGFKFVWTDQELPAGGAVELFDDCSDVSVLLHRPSFEQDPYAFMDELERVAGCQANARSQMYLRRAG